VEHSEELKQKTREVLLSVLHRDNVLKILKCTVCGVVLSEHEARDCPDEESKYDLVQENEKNIARYVMEYLK
jgi:hypothetical protein